MPDTLDTSGLTCPIPILKAKKALAKLDPGDVLTVLATDPGSVADFEVLCLVQGHTLLSNTQQDGTYYFKIQRGPAKRV
jgi:tRNA 2-thiouridine synthesizing protein A